MTKEQAVDYLTRHGIVLEGEEGRWDVEQILAIVREKVMGFDSEFLEELSLREIQHLICGAEIHFGGEYPHFSEVQ